MQPSAGPPTFQPSKSTYNQKDPILYIPAVISFIAIFISSVFWQYRQDLIVTLAVGGLLLVISVFGLIRQLSIIRKYYPRVLTLEVILAIGIVILPATAFLIADQHGSATYGTPSDISIATIVFFTLSSCVMAMATACIGNALFFLCKATKVIKIVGAILYGITWLVLLLGAVIIYLIEYSIHDPASE